MVKSVSDKVTNGQIAFAWFPVIILSWYSRVFTYKGMYLHIGVTQMLVYQNLGKLDKYGRNEYFEHASQYTMQNLFWLSMTLTGKWIQ